MHRHHLSEVNQVLGKLLSIPLYTEHQRDEVLWAGGKQVEESSEDGETVEKGAEAGWSKGEAQMHKLSI